jgi:NAD(P)-dependent dehydrogenase (short-subunit alcohol dehydrogenase family)
VREEVGEISILVNNAGIMPCHPLLQHNHQEIRKIFEINILAHFWVSFEQFSFFRCFQTIVNQEGNCCHNRALETTADLPQAS